MIPHPNIPLLEIRTLDIWLLLGAGAILELFCRTLAGFSKLPSEKEALLQRDLKVLQYETAQKRRLGPSAFVETSKLERKLLQHEKDLEKMREQRNKGSKDVAKVIRNASLAVYALLFLVYYGIPIVSLDGFKIQSDDPLDSEELTAHDRATHFLQGFMFPISYIGFGVKIARIGVPNPTSSIGALVVLWSSQVTVGKILDCVEAMTA